MLGLPGRVTSTGRQMSAACLLRPLHCFPCPTEPWPPSLPTAPLPGRDEYSLVDALKAGRITKPVVAWVRRAGAGRTDTLISAPLRDFFQAMPCRGL